MHLIHRFSSRSINTPTRLFDKDKLRSYITKGQKHTDPMDTEAFIQVVMSKRGTIGQALKPLSDEMREGKGAATIMGNNVGKPKWWQTALLATWSMPQIKLYAYNNFTLAIYEEPTTGSRNGYRLVLSIETQNSVKILAASDETVKKAIKVNIKQGAQTS